MSKKLNKGFTLAEVLITLSVVGVVAALVIPGLFQTNDDSLKTAWRKTYAEIAQATRQMVLDNGGSLNGLFSNHEDVIKKYSGYLKIVKECDFTNYADNCWPSKYYRLNGNVENQLQYCYYTDENSVCAGGEPKDVSAALLNGTFIAVAAIFTNPNTNYYTPEMKPGLSAILFVDVNGKKLPNTVGKDIFCIYILKDRILPCGEGLQTYGSVASWSCKEPNEEGHSDSMNYGIACGARYLRQ